MLEYGQIPVQLFDLPHPKKNKKYLINQANSLNQFDADGMIIKNNKLKEENDRLRSELELLKVNSRREKEKIIKEYEECKLKLKQEIIIKEKRFPNDKESLDKNIKLEKETNNFPDEIKENKIQHEMYL